MNKNFSYWKNISMKMFLAMRVMFLLSIIWDFFLTVAVSSSARAPVILIGLGAVLSPYIVALWLIVIVGVMIILARILSQHDPSYITKYGYIVFILALVLYTALALLAAINPVVSWPVVISFLTNAIWSILILYFRKKIKDGVDDQADMAKW